MSVEFPAFLKIEYQRDGSAAQTLLADIDSGLGKAEARFREFSDVAQAQVDIALGRGRNASGSLDLDVPGLQAAAKAQEARAIAAREVAQATALAAREEGDYSRTARLATAATEALAREEEDAARAARAHADAAEQVQERLNRQKSATDAVVLATSRGTTANGSLINSQSALRQASVQAGQQLQDVAISLYSGQQATVVFAQQLPQLAFALSGLEGSANKTHDRVGRFATLLSGPWGLAVGVASGAIVGLVINMLDLDEETEKTKTSAEDLTSAFNYQTTATDELNAALEEQIKRQRDANDVGRTSAVVAYDQAKANLANALAVREQIKALIEKREQTARDVASLGEDPGGALDLRDATVKRLLDPQNAAIANLEELLNRKFIPAAAQLQNSAADAAYDRSLAALNREFQAKKKVTDEDRAQYQVRLAKITADKEAAQQAEREAQRRSSRGDAANRQTGREVNSAQARSIAEAAGFNVISADRTRAQQQRLYDTVRTPQNPVALPGTSAHEKGNALDIAFGAGVTPASIRKAFADEGVRLTKLLKETGHFHIEWSTAGADKAQREADAIARKMQQLREFGERAADQIANISGRFDEQPRLIDAAAAAARSLDDTIRELAERQPPGFENLIADAERAKGVIADALQRPFRELAEDSERQVEFQRLILGGREKEAVVLQEIWRLQEVVGDLTADQRAEIERIVLARENELEALDRLRDKQQSYLSATQGVRAELESLFSGEGFDLQRVFKRLTAQVSVEDIFGDELRKLDKTVQSKFDLGADAIRAEGLRVGREFGRVADAASDLAFTLSNPSASALGGGPGAFDETAWYDFLGEFDKQFSGRSGASNDNEIVVTGTRDPAVARAIERSAIGLSPNAYADMLGRALVRPLLAGLPTAIAGPLSGILGGAVGGYATGGAPGAALGLLRGATFELGPDVFGKGLTDKLLGGFDKALGGAATGGQIAGIGNALGIKMSNTGAQIGGAIGSFIPIPGGQIIGSIAGGLLGGLFSKTPDGNLGITGLDSRTQARASKGEIGQELGGLAGQLSTSIKSIADALGASVGAFSVSLGKRNDYYRVGADANFDAGSKYAKGSLYDGTDPQKALEIALRDALSDGAIKGLKAAEQRLIQAGGDIQAAIQDVLDFRSVSKRLRGYKDPVGAALDELDAEFSKLEDVFNRAGASAAELAELEELYAIERKKAIEVAGKQVVGSLQSLLDSLNIGDNGLSLRDRQANAMSQYDGLATRVRAGDVTAYDAYAQSARDLLDIERQLYGSTQQYFQRFNEVRGLSQSVVDAQQRLADQAAARDSGLDAGIVRDSVNSQTQVLGQKLDAVNDNLRALGGILGGIGGESLAARYGLVTVLR